MRYTDKEKRKLADAFIASLEEGSAPYGKEYAVGHRDGFQEARGIYDNSAIPEIDVDADVKAFAQAGSFSVEDMVKGLAKAFNIEEVDLGEVEVDEEMFTIEECYCAKVGDRVIDGLTGFKGTATALCHYIHGESQVEITAHVGADNKLPETMWVDASRIEKV